MGTVNTTEEFVFLCIGFFIGFSSATLGIVCVKMFLMFKDLKQTEKLIGHMQSLSEGIKRETYAIKSMLDKKQHTET